MQCENGRKKKIHSRKNSRSVGGLASTELAARSIAKQKAMRKLLEQFHSPHWINSDPIQYAHRYTEPGDQEIAAFIGACFAYGSVKLVHRAVEAVLKPMGRSPAEFVRRFDGANCWPGFYHRFHHEWHVVALVLVLKRALLEYGSLGELFRQSQDVESESERCESVLNGAADWLRKHSLEIATRLGRPDIERGLRFFFNAPKDGSACKRMAMFLRWMVRKDDIDLGLWSWMHPKDLVVPADTHVARIAYYLRLRGGKEKASANWKMAREITESLRAFDPNDPVRYDFALARLGILDICKRRYTKSICERCPVESVCRFSNQK